jgi:phosphodiesterase/alkaline phosphatase D-like protein
MKNITVASIAALLLLFTIAGFAQERKEAVRITNGPNVEFVGADRAQIAWSTNVNSGQIVRYGTEPNHLAEMKEARWGGEREKNGDYLHKLELSGLTPGTTYYFDVESSKAAETGTNLIGNVKSFQTKGTATELRKTPAAERH